MADSPVLYALRRKYAVLKGELAVARNRLAATEDALTHVAATIRLFRADEDLDAIKPVRSMKAWKPPTRRFWAPRCMAVLREATRPLTIHEIAVQIVAKEGLTYTPALGQNVRASVRDVLNRRIGKGVVQHEGKPARWSREVQS